VPPVVKSKGQNQLLVPTSRFSPSNGGRNKDLRHRQITSIEEALRANLEGNTEISETGLMDIVDRAALQKKKQQEEEDEVLRSF